MNAVQFEQTVGWEGLETVEGEGWFEKVGHWEWLSGQTWPGHALLCFPSLDPESCLETGLCRQMPLSQAQKQRSQMGRDFGNHELKQIFPP